MTALAGAAPARPLRRGRLLALALLWFVPLPGLASGCTSTVTPPRRPADPATVFLLREAMHTGLVLPPMDADLGAEYIEFGFGDWGWFALGNDQWYHVFATVLWPTQGALGRRSFGARTERELRARVTWAELSPVVVSAAKAGSLRRRLQDTFDHGREALVERRELGFQFVPLDEAYWFPHNCADVAARWFQELDCHVGWTPFRTGLAVAPQ